MGFDKVVDSAKLDGAMAATAEVIRWKTNSADKVVWDEETGFREAVRAISGVGLQEKTVAPKHSEQVIVPDEQYDGLSSVKVLPVPRLPAAVASVEVGADSEFENVVNLDAGVSISGVATEDLAFFYEVQAVEGASYGFNGKSVGPYVDNNGNVIGNNPGTYYTSGNKDISSSYAICKIVFRSTTERTITINCINYADEFSDYGIVSNLNVLLAMSTGDDGATGSTNVLHNFKSENSVNAVPISVTIPAGESFISVKFRKDSSGNRYNDSFAFAIQV